MWATPAQQVDDMAIAIQRVIGDYNRYDTVETVKRAIRHEFDRRFEQVIDIDEGSA